MLEDEISQLQAGLAQYCSRHYVSPDELLGTWLDYPELTVRRRPDPRFTPNLAAESFLIHNGVNVFGEITCVAGRLDDLAEQGSWFVAAAMAGRPAQVPGQASEQEATE